MTPRPVLMDLFSGAGGAARGYQRAGFHVIGVDIRPQPHYADTIAALKAHQRRQAAERAPSWAYWGLVFVTPTGQPWHGRDVLRAFHVACDTAGIARRRIHDLRGSSLTLMADLGVPEDVRMARAGHSTQQMARRYAQAGPAQDRMAAERLGEALR